MSTMQQLLESMDRISEAEKKIEAVPGQQDQFKITDEAGKVTIVNKEALDAIEGDDDNKTPGFNEEQINEVPPAPWKAKAMKQDQDDTQHYAKYIKHDTNKNAADRLKGAIDKDREDLAIDGGPDRRDDADKKYGVFSGTSGKAMKKFASKEGAEHYIGRMEKKGMGDNLQVKAIKAKSMNESGDFDLDDEWGTDDMKVDDNMFSDPDFEMGDDFALDDDDIGMDFGFEDAVQDDVIIVDSAAEEDEWGSAMGYDQDDEEEMIGPQGEWDDDDDQPDYELFNLEKSAKRLTPGTPIIFSADIGGGEGLFIDKRQDGSFGTAERNGKVISLHLSDIAMADLTWDPDNNFNEGFDSVMDALMESEEVQEPEQETDAGTAKISIEVPTDELIDFLKLTGIQGQDSDKEVYQQYGDDDVAPQEPEQDPNMKTLLDKIQSPHQDQAEMESDHSGYEDDDDDDDKGFISQPQFKQDGRTPGEQMRDGYDDDDEQVDEGLGKSIKRGMQGWGGKNLAMTGNKNSPGDIRARIRDMDTDFLQKLAKREGGSSPAGLQAKLARQELKRRSQRESVDEEFANEPDEKMASANTQLNAMAGGLNKPKVQYSDHQQGDNPMTIKQDEMNESEEMDSFLNLYKEFKQF